MKTIETNIMVTPRRTMTLRLPADVEPGEHYIVVHIREGLERHVHRWKLSLPVFHTRRWPANLSLRREDMYGDDGR